MDVLYLLKLQSSLPVFSHELVRMQYFWLKKAKVYEFQFNGLEFIGGCATKLYSMMLQQVPVLNGMLVHYRYIMVDCLLQPSIFSNFYLIIEY